MRKFLLLFIYLSIVTSVSFGQAKTSISGRIADKSAYLPGVSVKILGTNQGIATDLEGRFQISNLNIGEVNLRISYLGYQTVEKRFKVKEGINDIGVIELEETAGNLEEYVVKGNLAPSQLKAISIKKNSMAIMDVIAADVIGKLPDRNAAEAVQRLPAVSVNRYHGEANQVSVRGTPYAWSSTLYNGTRLPSANVFGNRNAVLDAIPAEMIQYVQLSKAITPDMEGDAIGGSVNFITRSAPANQLFNLSFGSGYSEKSQNGTYNGSVVYGNRFLKNKLGIVLAGSIWKRNFSADELAVDYNLSRANASERYSINTINAKRYYGSRLTAAINAAVEYEFNSGNKVYTRLVEDRFEDVRPVYETYYEFNNKRYRYSNRESDYKTSLRGIEFGGMHKLSNRIKIDWTASQYDMYYRLDTPPAMPADQKGLPIAQFFQRLNGDFAGRSSDGLIYSSFDAPDNKGIDLYSYTTQVTNQEADKLNPAKLRLEQLIIYQIDQRDKDNVAQVNAQFDITEKFSLKFGSKVRYKNISGEFTPLVFLPNARLGIPGAKPIRLLSEFETATFQAPGTYFGELNGQFNGVALNPMTQEQMFAIFSPSFFKDNDINDRSAATNVTTKYNGSENITAAYFMFTYHLTPKTLVYGGVRNEFTAIEMNSNSYDNVQKKAIPQTGTFSYNSFLPMLHLKTSPTEKLNIRLAGTRTLARPNFPDLNPAENIDITGGVPRITRGNTQLKPTYSTNLDVMGEYFLDDIGLISGGVFYKNISNFIFRNTSLETVNGTNYFVTQPKNIENANLLGFEMGITKRFSKLPSFWSGFGIDVNYTRIESKLDVPRLDATGKVIATDRTSLPNQSKHLFNTSLFYEKNGLMLRLAGNFRGKSVESINQNLGPDYYTYVDNNFTVDLSGTYSLSQKLKMFVEVRNLTNEPFVQYLGANPLRITSSEWHSVSGQLGLKLAIF